MLRGIDLRDYRPAAGVEYPRSPLGLALQQIAQLVKSQVGLEVAFAETGGWDTHVQQERTVRRVQPPRRRPVALDRGLLA